MTARMGRGAVCSRGCLTPSPSGSPDALTYHGESKSSCPVDGQPVPLGFGRPRTYCSDECRREMARRRHELAAKDAELADARQKAADGYRPGRYFWDGMAAMHERQLAELSDLVPEHLR